MISRVKLGSARSSHGFRQDSLRPFLQDPREDGAKKLFAELRRIWKP